MSPYSTIPVIYAEYYGYCGKETLKFIREEDEHLIIANKLTNIEFSISKYHLQNALIDKLHSQKYILSFETCEDGVTLYAGDYLGHKISFKANSILDSLLSLTYFLIKFTKDIK